MTSIYNEDLHIKMCKKIAQLTKVIYNLNSKAEEHDSIVDAIKKEHKSNITRIIKESKEQLLVYQSKCKEHENHEKQMKQTTSMCKELEDHNKRLQSSFDEYIEKSALNERNLRSDYENKLLDLQNKLLERRREHVELLDKFESFQKELVASKQGKAVEISRTHNELQKMRTKFSQEIDRYEHKQKKLENTLEEVKTEKENCKQEWVKERSRITFENEEKILKLKALHEKEMNSKYSQIKMEEYNKLQKEKESLIKEFELKKAESQNRIRFLENSSDKLEEENESLSKTNKEKMIKLKSLEEKISSLHLQLGEKQMEIEGLEKEIASKNESISKQIAINDEHLRHSKGTYNFFSLFCYYSKYCIFYYKIIPLVNFPYVCRKL